MAATLGAALIEQDIATLRRLRAREVRGSHRWTRISRRLLLLVRYLDEAAPDAAARQRQLEASI